MSTKKANRDRLTGLVTKDSFEDIFGQVLEQAQARGRPASLALIDIDGFMQVNEAYGQQAGDDVLVGVAGKIVELAGKEAVGVRYGGDEFALILPDTERERAFLLLEEMRAAVEQIETYGQGAHAVAERLTISGGIASCPIDGTSPGQLLRQADQALYRAKVAGRNTIRLAYEEKMAPKTAHFTLTQLERLSNLAKEQGVGEAVLLREGLDDLLFKYGVDPIES